MSPQNELTFLLLQQQTYSDQDKFQFDNEPDRRVHKLSLESVR